MLHIYKSSGKFSKCQIVNIQKNRALPKHTTPRNVKIASQNFKLLNKKQKLISKYRQKEWCYCKKFHCITTELTAIQQPLIYEIQSENRIMTM
uniref:Uncharacterized protein n=1 Tax=Octopus bimaculoides TaxID=37653 RepID=A0A0L8I993_OCTBM